MIVCNILFCIMLCLTVHVIFGTCINAKSMSRKRSSATTESDGNGTETLDTEYHHCHCQGNDIVYMHCRLTQTLEAWN